MKIRLTIFLTFIYLSVFSQLNPSIESQFFRDTLFSKSLNENRLLTIYLPIGFNRDSIYPVIYTTDGQIINESYQKKLDSLINFKLIPKLVLIGVHSHETPVKGAGEIRNFEYMENRSSDNDTVYGMKFNQHMQFFSNEVLIYTEAKYSVSRLKKDRFFYGVSNGADYGVSLAMHKAYLFENYIYCSIFNGTSLKYKWTINDKLNFYIYYGNKEMSEVKDNSNDLCAYLKRNDLNYTIKSYSGGHDRLKWEEMFFESLTIIYSIEK